MTERMVFLVPGFFGFSTVAAVSYFQDVEDALRRGLSRRRVDAHIVRCDTQPTASIVRRADRLRRQVIDHGGLKAQATALRRSLHGRARRAHAADARRDDRTRQLRGTDRRAHANRDFSSDAAPWHAARESFQHRPGSDSAAHCERACHVRAGTRGDCRRGAGGRPGRATRRLDGPLGHGARSHCSRPVAEDPLQPPRPHLEVPQGDRDGPGRGAATHARGNEPLRRGRGPTVSASTMVASSPAYRNHGRSSGHEIWWIRSAWRSGRCSGCCTH